MKSLKKYARHVMFNNVAPQYIRYPQDTSLLNEARSKLKR